MTMLLLLLLLLVLHADLGAGGGGSDGGRNNCVDPFQSEGDFCYFLDSSGTLQTWMAARQMCQEMGSDLAVIHTCRQFADLVRHIHMTGQELSPGMAYWIGGTDQGDEGAWYWIDFTPMAMGVPFWGEVNGVYEPSGGDTQNCASLYRDDRYYIHDAECKNGAYAICQYSVSSPPQALMPVQ